MFLSFLGGAARQFVSSAEQAEEDAKQMAKSSFNGLYKRYEENAETNRELINKMKAEKQYIETVWSSATPEQVNELLANPVALEAIKKVKNPQNVSLDNYIKVIKGNPSKATAAERAAALPDLVERAKEGLRPTKKAGFAGFIESFGDTRFDADMEKYARGQGMTLEQLRSAERVSRPEGSATFNMSALEPVKSFQERTEQAQVNMVDALNSGDKNKIDLARKELNTISTVKQELTPAQQQFANKVADIKNRYMFGTPEQRKAATPEYDKLMSDIRAEAMAKKVTKDGEGEGKIPALSTLNTFTSAAVARAVQAKHGDLIKTKQLAIVEKADGSVGIDYIGDDETLRRQILMTQANAAKNALSLYTDAQGRPFNRDVASVLNSFTSIVPSVVRTDGGTPPAATPAAAPQPTTAPVRNFRSVQEAEAANLPKGTKITINGRPAEVQ